MNEEAVELGKKQLQEGLTYNLVAFLFIKQAYQIVEEYMQILREDEFHVFEQSKLPRAEEELFYLSVFALDYWWQKSPSYTQEQKRTLEKVLLHHLETGFGNDAEGWPVWDTLRERIVAYGQTASELEQKDDSLMVADLAYRLSEYCGMSYLPFAILVPTLFTDAMKIVFVLKGDKRRPK